MGMAWGVGPVGFAVPFWIRGWRQSTDDCPIRGLRRFDTRGRGYPTALWADISDQAAEAVTTMGTRSRACPTPPLPRLYGGRCGRNRSQADEQPIRNARGPFESFKASPRGR